MIGMNGEPVRVWVATAPVDMRRGFDRLAEHVRAFLGRDPLSGHLFVFRSRNGARVKILWWDKSGLVLYYKRLERGTFHFPSSDSPCMELEAGQLLRLLSGGEVVQRVAAVQSA